MKLKVFLALLLLVVNASLHSQNTRKKKKIKAASTASVNPDLSGKKFTVSGKVTRTDSYCGGAAPSEEIMQELSTPKPYGGRVFYVRKGNTNNLSVPVTLSFTPGDKGVFSFELPAGTWSIILAEQLKEFKASDFKSSSSQQIDLKCLEEWWAKPYYLLEIKDKEVSNLNFNFHRQCFVNTDLPCFYYTGPMPP